MNKNFTQITAMLALSLAFVLFNTTDKILMKTNENAQAVNTKNKTEVTSDSTEITSELNTVTENINTTAITEITGVSSESATESSVSTSSTAFRSSGLKELGAYSADFISLTSDQIASIYTEGIVIVGDSIASGYKVYNRLPESQVMAVGSLGARNIHDFKMPLNGAEYDIKDAINILKPKYICMSMGMNDLNIGTMEEFITNYTTNINELLTVSPDSQFIIMAITPISSESKHSTNTIIDSYNQALYQMVEQRNDIPIYYVNAAQVLKNEWNTLSSSYSGGDGIHLAPASYDAMLTYLLGALSEIDSTYTDKPAVPEETSAPSWSDSTTAPSYSAEY